MLRRNLLQYCYLTPRRNISRYKLRIVLTNTILAPGYELAGAQCRSRHALAQCTRTLSTGCKSSRTWYLRRALRVIIKEIQVVGPQVQRMGVASYVVDGGARRPGKGLAMPKSGEKENKKNPDRLKSTPSSKPDAELNRCISDLTVLSRFLTSTVEAQLTIPSPWSRRCLGHSHPPVPDF